MEQRCDHCVLDKYKCTQTLRQFRWSKSQNHTTVRTRWLGHHVSRVQCPIYIGDPTCKCSLPLMSSSLYNEIASRFGVQFQVLTVLFLSQSNALGMLYAIWQHDFGMTSKRLVFGDDNTCTWSARLVCIVTPNRIILTADQVLFSRACSSMSTVSITKASLWMQQHVLCILVDIWITCMSEMHLLTGRSRQMDQHMFFLLLSKRCISLVDIWIACLL